MLSVDVYRFSSVDTENVLSGKHNLLSLIEDTKQLYAKLTLNKNMLRKF
jgi:hypothetical protein